MEKIKHLYVLIHPFYSAPGGASNAPASWYLTHEESLLKHWKDVIDRVRSDPGAALYIEPQLQTKWPAEDTIPKGASADFERKLFEYARHRLGSRAFFEVTQLRKHVNRSTKQFAFGEYFHACVSDNSVKLAKFVGMDPKKIHPMPDLSVILHGSREKGELPRIITPDHWKDLSLEERKAIVEENLGKTEQVYSRKLRQLLERNSRESQHRIDVLRGFSLLSKPKPKHKP